MKLYASRWVCKLRTGPDHGGDRNMKVDCGITKETEFHDLDALAAQSKKFEELGFDAMVIAEMAHDPFLPFMIAAHATDSLQMRTSIAVALSRNPMIVANLAHDLNAYSKGRFVLGLGSQIKPHITKRFSMPWHAPAAQMREFIQALRAIFACWYDNEPLNFQGEMYTHRLMTPMFTPTNTEYGKPRIALAAVGPMMTQVASEEADGIILHAFNSEKYLREVIMPRIEEGLKNSNRDRSEFEVSFPMFIVTGDTEEAFEKTKQAVKQQLAFYGSTPSYKGVFECHGWFDLQPELNRLSKEGEWVAMGELISDEVLNAIAVVGEPLEVAEQIKRRFGDIIDRVTMNPDLSPSKLSQQFEILRA